MARKEQRTEAAPPASAAPSAVASHGGYTVLARRYRSRDFDEIVGQEAIARTLKNAVATGRIGHAYLFCGSRGVGKTSMARILARAINAAPGELTQAAEIGEAILRGNDLDVVEIDGASNRGVDDARSLIAAAGLSPARCKFKIYIIDEVHMLTKEAFNALLKTMEEPPQHVKFILCTTEPEKLPATIRSRCQRFDFRLLSSAEIAGQLRRIVSSEHVDADDPVIAQVARLARGSMRDGLSLLDRLLAAGEAKLTVPMMEQMLGLPDHALASKLVDAIVAGDAAAGLRAASAMIDGGATVEQALEVVMEHLRDLMLVATCGSDCEFLELTPEARAAAAEQARHFDAPGLVHLIAVCEAAARSARLSAVARAIFDAAIVRMCRSERFADVASLLEGGDGAAREPAGSKKKGTLAAPAAPRPPVEISVEAKPAAEPAKTDPAKTDPAKTDPAKTDPATAEPATADPGPALWDAVCRAASATPSEHALVEHLVFRGFDGRALRLAITTAEAGLSGWLSTQAAAVAELVQRTAARRVEVVIESPAQPAARSPAARIKAAQELPLVRSAMAIFDATVVDVQEERPEAGGAGEDEEDV
jgi:DNA polymerase-3 subunit gamma/tau